MGNFRKDVSVEQGETDRVEIMPKYSGMEEQSWGERQVRCKNEH